MPQTETRVDVTREPTLTVASVARRLGVSPTTLRTWDRRHGLGPSLHRAGTHRRYSTTDLARLELMRRLTVEGVGAGEAARIALATPDADLPPVLPLAAGDGPGRTSDEVSPGATDRVRGLVKAAEGLDATTVTGLIRESLERRGVVPTWDGLIVPAMMRIGRRWERTGSGVEVEHLASECVLGALRHHAESMVQTPVSSRPVLLACAAQDLHSLPLYAVSAALAERHVASRVLGARVPIDALSAAMSRMGPAAVFIWSQLADTGDPSQLAALPEIRPRPIVALGGPGWSADAGRAAPRHQVVVVSDLSETVSLLARSVGA